MISSRSKILLFAKLYFSTSNSICFNIWHLTCSPKQGDSDRNSVNKGGLLQVLVSVLTDQLQTKDNQFDKVI